MNSYISYFFAKFVERSISQMLFFSISLIVTVFIDNCSRRVSKLELVAEILAHSVIIETRKLIARAAITTARLNQIISAVEKFDDCNALIRSSNCFSVSTGYSPKNICYDSIDYARFSIVQTKIKHHCTPIKIIWIDSL